MTLDQIKAKSLETLAAKYAPKPLAESVQEDATTLTINGSGPLTVTTSSGTVTVTGDVTIDGAVQFEDIQIEGKKHKTPEFVRHCVTAITEKPKTLDRVKKDAPAGSDGSPFAICWAQYNKNKRSLAAKHSKGEHHSDKQYEKALAKLRNESEELQQKRLARRQVVFESVEQAPSRRQRRNIRFAPRG